MVAEGAETEAELRRLTELGCDLAQGYHVGRPVPAEALTAQMRELAAVAVAAAATQAAARPPAVARASAGPTAVEPVAAEAAAAAPAGADERPPVAVVTTAAPRPRPLKALEGLERIRLELEEIDATREATALSAS